MGARQAAQSHPGAAVGAPVTGALGRVVSVFCDERVEHEEDSGSSCSSSGGSSCASGGEEEDNKVTKNQKTPIGISIGCSSESSLNAHWRSIITNQKIEVSTAVLEKAQSEGWPKPSL